MEFLNDVCLGMMRCPQEAFGPEAVENAKRWDGLMLSNDGSGIKNDGAHGGTCLEYLGLSVNKVAQAGQDSELTFAG